MITFSRPPVAYHFAGAVPAALAAQAYGHGLVSTDEILLCLVVLWCLAHQHINR